jgi:hypothetical protein
MMWEFALKLDTEARRLQHGPLSHLADLQDEEYDECLEKVSAYFKANKPLRRFGRQVLLKPDLGPRSAGDREASFEDYNGEDGGRVFKWYVRAYFEAEIARLGAGRDTMTEAQCMRALRATSVFLRQLPEVQKSLKEYAGPQCYPQLEERGRWRGNQQHDPELTRGGAVPESGNELDDFRACWMCCDSCSRWRFVRKECLPALCNKDFQARLGSGPRVNWREWLSGAGDRYNAFLARRDGGGGQVSNGDGRAIEVAGEACGDNDAALSEHVAKPVALCNQDDVGRLESEGECAGGDVEDCLESESSSGDNDDEVKAHVAEGFRNIGSYSGGYTEKDKQDARKAELGENRLRGSWMVRSGAKRRKTAAGCVGSEAQRRIKFECRMLQRWENEAGQCRWSTMSCDVEDDFDLLRSLSWPMEAFCEQTRVVLLHADARTPSTVSGGFARMGLSLKAGLAVMRPLITSWRCVWIRSTREATCL